MRKRHSRAKSDEELLLRSVMPEEQVNAMLANTEPMTQYNPDSRPVVNLLKGMLERPPTKQMVVEKDKFRLELRDKGAAA